MEMTSVGATKPGAAVSTTFFTGSQPVFLDSGTTLCYLPAAIMAPIVKATGATPYQPGSSQYVVPCDMMNQPGSIEFGFGNLTISVPYKQFLWQAGTDDFGDVVCVLGVMESDPVQKAFVLGDTFLRSAFGESLIPLLPKLTS
jgi:Eukaryotic aspartyl protease